MNIAAISYFYHPVVNGVVLTIDDWKLQGKKHGATFTIVAPHHEGEREEPDVVRFPSVSVLRRFGITLPWFPDTFVEQELQAREIDLVHVHHPFFLGDLALLMGKRLGVPVVFTYHTRYSEYARAYLSFLPGGVIDAIVDRLTVSFMNRCTAITVALPTLADELGKKGVCVPIHVVPIGIDTKRFAHGKGEAVRKMLGISNPTKLLISVGRIAKEKNVLFLLNAMAYIFAKFPDVHFCFIGRGPAETEVRARIRDLGLKQRLHILDVPASGNIADYYAAGDLFVSASTTETFGRVFVEAMAAGLPVVAARTATIGDVVEDSVTGLIADTATPAAFGKSIVRALADRRLAGRLGKNARHRAKAQFDISVSWQILARAYEAVRASGSS